MRPNIEILKIKAIDEKKRQKHKRRLVILNSNCNVFNSSRSDGHERPEYTP